MMQEDRGSWLKHPGFNEFLNANSPSLAPAFAAEVIARREPIMILVRRLVPFCDFTMFHLWKFRIFHDLSMANLVAVIGTWRYFPGARTSGELRKYWGTQDTLGFGRAFV